MARKKARGFAKDPLAKVYGAKGTHLTIHVDRELLKFVDESRAQLDEEWGILVDRATMLENLVKRVWREKMEELHAREIGGKLSDKINHGGGDE